MDYEIGDLFEVFPLLTAEFQKSPRFRVNFKERVSPESAGDSFLLERGFKQQGSSILFSVAFLVVFGYALYIFWKVMYARYRYIQLGVPELYRDWNERIRLAACQIFEQTKIL
jgi:hypothetical protein